MRRSRLQACFHFLGKRNAVNEQIGSPIEGISSSVTTGGTKIPAELFLGSRKLHLEKRKENINFSKANVVNLKKYRCQEDERVENRKKIRETPECFASGLFKCVK